jgi:hypothetical protein
MLLLSIPKFDLFMGNLLKKYSVRRFLFTLFYVFKQQTQNPLEPGSFMKDGGRGQTI